MCFLRTRVLLNGKRKPNETEIFPLRNIQYRHKAPLIQLIRKWVKMFETTAVIETRNSHMCARLRHKQSKTCYWSKSVEDQREPYEFRVAIGSFGAVFKIFSKNFISLSSLCSPNLCSSFFPFEYLKINTVLIATWIFQKTSLSLHWKLRFQGAAVSK